MTGAAAAPRRIELKAERDIAAARSAVSRACDELQASALRKVRFVTAVSEIARNALEHGGGGTLEISASRAPRRIAVLCHDNGPGILDIDQAMRDGFTTAGSMGKGLGGARRLVDRFEIRNRPEGGVEVRMSSQV
ncbi:ATP-binding protein [Pseudoroseicyclus aestuarii]|uniref:Serine/threonine-protein kinase RsbT n=1 Tax=Pseudoroseicyclus aestuarii TaxID=1795041 RepID=A0A318TB95_9RHOB|nr:ATP-binding protein [Pseudoroseicyclus aestuarii]PYE85598.1 serine/threonine-protein kinase RsbT [Pseudoroseicyclus aestuarii]